MSDNKSQWYKPKINTSKLRELSQKKNLQGSIQFFVFFLLLYSVGYGAYVSNEFMITILIFMIYGQLYGFINACQHELMHKSVFRSGWMNRAGLWCSSLLLAKEQVYNYYSHLQHHNATLIEGKDIEGQPFNRPPNIFFDSLNLIFKYRDNFGHFKAILIHSFGGTTHEAKIFVPKSKFREMRINSRINLIFEFSIIGFSFVSQSWYPLLLIIFPRYYGGLIHNLCASTQHTGFPINANDHRLNTRTVRMNRLMCFLYWNMNYHVEHHLYPSVPFHALEKLHLELKDQLKEPSKSLLAAWKEMLKCLVIQLKNPNYSIIPN